MSIQNKELQIISIDRNGGFSDRRAGGYACQKTFVRVRRRQRRKLARRLCLCLLCSCIAILAALCWRINWFSDAAEVRGRNTQIRRLKEEIVSAENEAVYSKELEELLEQNEETYEFVKDYPNRADFMGREIDLSEDCDTNDVPLLMQWDKRWGYDLYGDAMIGIAGCGPTCMTMAYLYLKDDMDMNPRKMAEFAQNAGYHTPDGTSWEFWTAGASAVGLYGEVVSLSENSMKNVLDGGGVIVCSMAPGDFTDTGHFILIRGYDGNGFFVNDPNRESNSDRQWDFETLSPQIKNLWGLYGA